MSTATASSLPTGQWSAAELVALAAAGLGPAQVLAHTRSYRSLAELVDATGLQVPISSTQARDRVGDGFALTVDAPGYPEHLRAAPAPPAVLYGLGDRSLLGQAGLAMTGTRNPSPLGITVSELIASAAAHASAGLVNGGAAGCDTRATQAAVQYEAPVVLVPATGPDQHPATPLALSTGGLVVSEHPFGVGTQDPHAPAYPSRLMARNRIIVGLSAVLVPASGRLNSGTAHACWAAFAAGRPVVVAQPRPSARSLPDAELALALAHEPGPTVGQLRQAGCPKAVAERIARPDRLAHAVATTPDELTAAVSVLLALSPWRPAAGSRATPVSVAGQRN